MAELQPGTLGAALEAEHRAIDGGIEAYLTTLQDGSADAAPLQQAMTGLRRHIYLEEQFLFPPLRASGMMMALLVMVKEHGELWRAMDGLDALLADGSADERAAACRDLLALLEAHNSKEEPIIYTKADDVLSAPASAELREFLASGSTPAGWKASKA